MTQHQEAVITIAVYLFLLGAVGFVSLVGWAIFRVKRMISKTDKILNYVKDLETIKNDHAG